MIPFRSQERRRRAAASLNNQIPAESDAIGHAKFLWEEGPLHLPNCWNFRLVPDLGPNPVAVLPIGHQQSRIQHYTSCTCK